MSTFEKSESWSGIHKGIRWEVKKRLRPLDIKELGDVWTSYFYVYDKCLPNTFKHLESTSELKSFTFMFGGDGFYMSEPDIISSLPFHYGCSYYEIINCESRKIRHIKVGDDYMHAWDLERVEGYSLWEVKSNICNVIDEFMDTIVKDFDPEFYEQHSRYGLKIVDADIQTKGGE